MNRGRARRLLVVAFALSLLVHLLVALVLHRQAATRENDIEVVSIVRRAAVITARPTPPPRPKATPVPHPVASSRPAPSKTHGALSTGSAGGKATATPAPTPQPAATATAVANACGKADAQAAVLENPPPPDIAPDVRAAGTSGVALVKVQLDAQGGVTDASVAQSTGNSSLDLVAVTMARDARYTPALHDCKPVAADYTFSVKFVAW